MKYSQNGLLITEFDEFVSSLQVTPLENYIKEASFVDVSHVFVRDTHTNDVIQYFTRNEPISGIFLFSLFDQEELTYIVKLSRGKFVKESFILSIFRKVYTLEKLFLSMECTKEINTQEHVLLALHPKVCSLLTWIMERFEALYSTPTRK